jgi:hypothetical protein
VAGTGQIDGIEIVLPDQAIEMRIDEVQAGSGPKMSQEAWLDMLDFERLAQQRIGIEINLADGKIVGGAPVSIDLAKFFGA